MTSVADIIRQLLQNLNLGGAQNEEWPVFVGFLPELPDDALCVYDTAGMLDGRLMRTGEQIEHAGIQIILRAQDYLEGSNKVTAIALALDEQYRETIEMDSDVGSFFIQNISRTGDLIPLGVGDDDRRRFHFSLNALVTYRTLA